MAGERFADIGSAFLFRSLCAKRCSNLLELIKGQFGPRGNSSQQEGIVTLKHLPPGSGY